mmetsp:Transcript_3975/g.16190  ORF Transcript_3975/g.16190 Transcript_3975/m.16190 type:complete len:228 (+) Transcript_3975:2574-3257(+)
MEHRKAKFHRNRTVRQSRAYRCSTPRAALCPGGQIIYQQNNKVPCSRNPSENYHQEESLQLRSEGRHFHLRSSKDETNAHRGAFLFSSCLCARTCSDNKHFAILLYFFQDVQQEVFFPFLPLRRSHALPHFFAAKKYLHLRSLTHRPCHRLQTNDANHLQQLYWIASVLCPIFYNYLTRILGSVQHKQTSQLESLLGFPPEGRMLGLKLPIPWPHQQTLKQKQKLPR